MKNGGDARHDDAAYVPPGWVSSRWAAELRRRAAACVTERRVAILALADAVSRSYPTDEQASRRPEKWELIWVAPDLSATDRLVLDQK